MLFLKGLQGRVKLPIGGIVREPSGRPGGTPGPTVTRTARREVWMEEDVLKLRMLL